MKAGRGLSNATEKPFTCLRLARVLILAAYSIEV